MVKLYAKLSPTRILFAEVSCLFLGFQSLFLEKPSIAIKPIQGEFVHGETLC